MGTEEEQPACQGKKVKECFVPDDDGCGCGFCTSVCLPCLPKVNVVPCKKVELWVENKHQEKECRLPMGHIHPQDKVTGED